MTEEEREAANPCRRFRDLLEDRDTYRRLAWLAICVQTSRSQAVTRAWDKGLDEHGVKLEADAHARKTAEMEVWLRRLAGRYRIAGKYWNSGGYSPITGTADCFAVGSGPGASCVISTQWKAPKVTYRDPSFDVALHNAMQGLVLHFGIDPVTSRVRATLVDFRAVAMSGFLDEGVVLFQGRPNFESLSANALVIYAWGTAVVAVKPGGDLSMKIPVRANGLTARQPILFDLQLRREPKSEVSVSRKEP